MNHGIKTTSRAQMAPYEWSQVGKSFNSLPVNAIPAISKRSVPRGTLVAFERKNQQPDPINAKLPRAKVKLLTFHVERFLERVASPEFVAEQAQPRRTIYLSGSGKSGLKRLLAIRPKIVPRGFCKPRGDLNQDSTRKKSAEGSTWNWLR